MLRWGSVKTEKVLHSVYKIVLRNQRKSETSQPYYILSSKHTYRRMRARVVAQLFHNSPLIGYKDVCLFFLSNLLHTNPCTTLSHTKRQHATTRWQQEQLKIFLECKIIYSTSVQRRDFENESWNYTLKQAPVQQFYSKYDVRKKAKQLPFR